ncbi:hypothetical protein GQ600_14681 [Phytophthora cactorum]|nr:hypothetical protein GQ600_14681 [Phytophthora cactorum]
MNLGGLWDATVGKYARWECGLRTAVPSPCGPSWSPFATFGACEDERRHVYESAVMYQDVLPTPTRRPYLCVALWNALFTIPVHVLGDGRAEYGHYGRMVRSWWIALQVTYGEYLSSLTILTLRSMKPIPCGTVATGLAKGAFGSCRLECPYVSSCHWRVWCPGVRVLWTYRRVPTSSDLEYAEVDFRVDDMGLSATVVLACIGVFSHGWRLCAGTAHAQGHARCQSKLGNTEAPPIADVPAGDEIYYYGDGDHTTGCLRTSLSVDGRWTRRSAPIGAPPQPTTSGHRAYGTVRCRTGTLLTQA